MKNLKINEKKIKEIFEKSIVITAIAFTLVATSGCVQKQPNDWPNEFQYITQKNNDFEKYTSTIIRNGQPTTGYRGENIAIAIDKETYEIKEYIFERENSSEKIYDLETK